MADDDFIHIRERHARALFGTLQAKITGVADEIRYTVYQVRTILTERAPHIVQLLETDLKLIKVVLILLIVFLALVILHRGLLLLRMSV